MFDDALRPDVDALRRDFAVACAALLALSDANARKNAGKVKGEFKKRSETSRGGERPRDRWD